MKNGLLRFEFYLNQLEILLTKAAKQKNPGLWLYRNNARTPLFMLEGLARLYIGIHNKKKFILLYEQFKILEDVLGAVDYYDVFAKEFSKNKKMPASVINYLQAQTREKIQSFNEILKEQNWISAENIKIEKIRKKLVKVEWLKEKAEVKAMNEFYGRSIYEMTAFAQATKFQFNNVESEVHELRRKMRWLSIYPQATLGCIQLGKSKDVPPHLTKYLTKEIVTSPFNKLPDAGTNKHFLLLEQNYFYSLSWMIAELGKIKDSGLGIIAIKEALQQTSTLTDDAAFKKAYQLLGTAQTPLSKLLENAGAITKEYFTEHNLEHLIIGVVGVK